MKRAKASEESEVKTLTTHNRYAASKEKFKQTIAKLTDHSSELRSMQEQRIAQALTRVEVSG